MKRYMLFEVLHYYPTGGMDDFKESFDKLSDIAEYIRNKKHTFSEKHVNYHIFDLERSLKSTDLARKELSCLSDNSCIFEIDCEHCNGLGYIGMLSDYDSCKHCLEEGVNLIN